MILLLLLHSLLADFLGLMSLDNSDILGGCGEGAPFFDDAYGSGSSHDLSWDDGPTLHAKIEPTRSLPANGKKGTQQL